MFTGLIQGLGTVQSVSANGKGLRAVIETPLSAKLTEGDSIAVNGVCSTALAISNTAFSVDYLPETLLKTTFASLQVQDKLNLECCLTLQTPLGGHLVSGHIDCTGKILNVETTGPFAILTVAYPGEFAPFLIPKGSIGIDGISLTVVEVTDDYFTCHLIPHTLASTNLHTKKVGDSVNLEFDTLAKYLYRFYNLQKPVSS
ncbi:MAG: riboflavin synthase [Candidatus Margulisiibacteriota bacterium]